MFSPSRGLDSFDQYLQDVEKYPLIQDPAEERALARPDKDNRAAIKYRVTNRAESRYRVIDVERSYAQ